MSKTPKTDALAEKIDFPWSYGTEMMVRHAEDMEKALAQRAEGFAQWQPIATAPREQVEILLYAPKEECKVFTGQMISGEWSRSSSDRHAPIDDFYGDGPLKPTHWMPLPASPDMNEERK